MKKLLGLGLVVLLGVAGLFLWPKPEPLRAFALTVNEAPVRAASDAWLAVIRQGQASLVPCAKDVRGSFEVVLHVDRSGAPMDAEANVAGAGPELAGCFHDAVANWHFPPPATAVRLRLQLRKNGDSLDMPEELVVPKLPKS
jgi:hypothetical protein